MRSRRLKVLVGLVVGVGALLAFASVDRCGQWDTNPPQLTGLGRATGAMKVGAARVPIALEFPATIAGYPPLRPSTSRAETPLEARATVVEVEGQRITLVQLDILFVTARMQLAVAAGFAGRVWLTATHTHTSVGGYDERPTAELAALGTASPRDEARLVTAARAAVEAATAALTPARLEVGHGSLEGLSVARTGDTVDSALTVVRFASEADGAPVLAQWLIASAHPTLASHTAALDGDWPARLAQKQPVTLVLQGAGGNAMANRDRAATPDAFADAVLGVVTSASPTPVVGPVALAWAEVAFGLPRPEASRLTPVLRAAVENVLCEGMEHDAMVSSLRLGPLSLLFVTFEVSARAGALLAQQARTDRIVSLANGYHGYLEPTDTASARAGESKLQYFDPQLARLVSDAARLAGDAVQAR